MALKVYYPQDICNALQAAAQSCGAALLAADRGGDDLTRGYSEGYRAALTTIALAFGLARQGRHDESIAWSSEFLFAITNDLNPSTLSRPPS
jgi:hypothetical protein